MPKNYILAGHEPVAEPDLWKFSDWFDKADRCVRRTRIKGGVDVSTVFLGINHNFFDNGPPVLFETMIFGGSQDQEYQIRSSTWDEALAAHRDAVLIACGAENVPLSEVKDLPSPRQQEIDAARAEEPPGPTWHERLLKDDEG